MKLVIHDLNEEAWDSVREKYDDCTVISDNGLIRPCTGCFSCWNRTPGRCVIKDGYEDMGQLVHQADEVIVISRYTYGGFSGFVKNVFDRCLGYVLPHFEVIAGETHHKKRYDEVKPFTFIFYGDHIGSDERKSAETYVKAVCANFRAEVREVVFRECGQEKRTVIRPDAEPGSRVILLNASMRSANGNSAKLARQLEKQLKSGTEIISLSKHLRDLSGLVRILGEASALVICVPLYVDGLPSQLIRLLETFRKEYSGPKMRIYVLANMGLYESSQLTSLFRAVKQWSAEMGFDYCGGLGISAGELVGGLMDIAGFRILPLKKAAAGMDQLSDAVDAGKGIGDLYVQPYLFPRSLYLFIANSGWKRMAKKNGIRPEDLYRRL
ncbi:MAG: NAD(P)H-dependent oxidoreductase [Solobacterium sp.]|nr:NAD(P)H-dependent oxidoreductase [Solobacterium sp.]